MASGITAKGDLFPNKLYQMLENEADDFIKWSKAGNWILICSDQQKFLSSAILTKYFMKNNFQNLVRQLNYYGFFAFKEEQKIAKAAGQLEIDPAYLYFRHESNYFKKGHPELLQRIKKSTRVTKRRASSMEENASNRETYPELLPKTKKTRKGNEAPEGDSRLGGTEIAKPSYRSQGQCGSGFIMSCTMDSQTPASTASQMHNTDNIDSSHGKGSENGDLNDDSSLHFKEAREFPNTIYNHVCAEYQEDQGRLYGVHLPRWCTNGEDLPEIYEVIARHLTTKGSDGIDTILEASNLPEDLLHHIQSIANKSVPGKWDPLELRIALGLVALAQKGTEKDQLTLEKLAALKRVPIPSFYGDIAQQLTITTQDSGEESGCVTEDQGNQEYVEEPPVTINPKEGPTEGKVPFSLEFRNIPISESVEFLLVEFGTGNVVEACRPRNSKNTWFGHTPPSNTSETVTVEVTIRTPDQTEVGKTSYTYYSNEVDAAFIVVARYLAQDEFNGEQQANPERGENSATSSFFGFSKQGEGSSVNILRRLVFTAARVGAEHFIRIVFGTSNGRIVYETYKTESLFPEDIAVANGHDGIAAYLISQSKRFCEESNTSQRQSKDVNWRELLKATQDKEAQSRRKKTRRKDEVGDYITESMISGDIEDSSDSDQERTEGRKEVKKKEVEGNDISENVYFGDNEDSSDSDPGRTAVEEEDAAFYGKESLSVDESCEVEVDEPSSDSPQLPFEEEHDITQSKSGQELIQIPRRLSLKKEGTDSMDSIVSSQKNAGERPNVSDVSNRCVTTLMPSLRKSKSLADGVDKYRKVQVTILASEWRSSKGGLSNINRELAIQLAKCPELEITFFLPQCSQEDKKLALKHNVKLVEATRLPGFEQLDWLCFPPDDLQIDIVVGHGVELGKQAQIIKRFKRCKWVQVVHTDPEELGMFKNYSNAVLKGEGKHKTEVELCKIADHVVGIGPKLSEAFRSYLRGCQKYGSVLDFTPGIIEEFEAVKQVPSKRQQLNVLVFGRGDVDDFELKGFDIVGKAVAALEDTRLVFVAAPDGKHKGIVERLGHFGVPASRLRVTGFVQDRDGLRRLFQEVDLVVMPSRTEGFGLTGLKAMSAGLPVLVNGNSSFGEALSSTTFGSLFVINSEDPTCWTAAIKKICAKDSRSRLQEVEILRHNYDKKYNWAKQIKCLVKEMISKVQEHDSSKAQNRSSETTNRASLQTKRLTEQHGVLDPSVVIERIRQLYRRLEQRPVSWFEDFRFRRNDICTRLMIETRDVLTDDKTNMTAIFNAHVECQRPRTVLIVGEPGMGKSMYCQKLAYDWSTKKKEWDSSFREIEVLLLLKCREIKSDVWKAIDDQILPEEMDDQAKECFFKFLRENQSKVLLVLDGLDEADPSKLKTFSKLVKGKELSDCYIVLTSRHEAGKKLRRHCDTLWEMYRTHPKRCKKLH